MDSEKRRIAAERSRATRANEEVEADGSRGAPPPPPGTCLRVENARGARAASTSANIGNTARRFDQLCEATSISLVGSAQH